jgi:hypothetical protein
MTDRGRFTRVRREGEVRPGTFVPQPTNDHLRELSTFSLLDYARALMRQLQTDGSPSPMRGEALRITHAKLQAELKSRKLRVEGF